MDEWYAELMASLTSEACRNFLMLCGVVVAVTSVMSAKATARRKQTADLLFGTRSDESLAKGYQRLRSLHYATDDNVRVYAQPEKRGSDAAHEIRYALNHWERTSVGITAEIYDEEMLRQANYSIVLTLFEQAEPFIKRVREETGKPTYYQELECLVRRWQKNPLKIKRK